MIEAFATRLLAKEESDKRQQDEKDRKAILEMSAAQEKVRFEQELHLLRTALHKELDEEKQAMREERQAFEALVVRFVHLERAYQAVLAYRRVGRRR